MRIVKCSNGYARKTVIALLEGDEVDLPNGVLMMMCDGRDRKVAQEIFDAKEHPGHFGGQLERKPGKKTKSLVFIKATIYTD